MRNQLLKILAFFFIASGLSTAQAMIFDCSPDSEAARILLKKSEVGGWSGDLFIYATQKSYKNANIFSFGRGVLKKYIQDGVEVDACIAGTLDMLVVRKAYPVGPNGSNLEGNF